MPNFKLHNYDQTSMVVVNYEEQLQLDPFALTLHHLIDHKINLAAFYDRYKNIESVFEQVLLVCDERGLLGHELLAIDGCKIPSNASKSHSGIHIDAC